MPVIADGNVVMLLSPEAVFTRDSTKRVLAIVILSIRLSRPATDSSTGEIETPGFYRMIAWSY